MPADHRVNRRTATLKLHVDSFDLGQFLEKVRNGDVGCGAGAGKIRRPALCPSDEFSQCFGPDSLD
jgi:hypothetical protein